MRITAFTSNQPRHLELLRALAEVADVVYAVQECVPIERKGASITGRPSDVIEHYFSFVNAAERKVFGTVSFLPPNVQTISLTFGDLRSIAYDMVAIHDARPPILA